MKPWCLLALATGLVLGGCPSQRQPRAAGPQQRVEVVKRAQAMVQAQAQVEVQHQAEALLLEAVYFDYRKHQLRDDQQKVLLRHVDKLKAYPEVKVTLAGHCDERGTREYNKALGQKRAESVRQFLVGQGIIPERLEVVSFGEEQPVDRGKTEAARARNRRVEFLIAH